MCTLCNYTYIPVGIYKATINDHGRITGLKAALYLKSASKGKSMNPTVIKTIALGAFVLGAWQAQPQEAKVPYPSMAPLDQYLIADRNAEIVLARTAAPPSISRDAKVMVLGSHGYETAVEGKNGFVCMVERAWMNPFDSPEFWNPKNRSPIC